MLVGAGAAVGATALTGAGAAQISNRELLDAQTAAQTAVGVSREPFYGKHQSGIETAHQSQAAFNVYRLTNSANAKTIAGVMRVATMEAARLCDGRPGLSDTDPELAEAPARLTITFGFGAGLFEAAGKGEQIPKGFKEIPALKIDALQAEWNGGDLLIQIGSDDPTTLAHATRHMTRVVSSIAVPHYSQHGFMRAAGTIPSGETPRNLFGQKDGTVNPRTKTEFAEQVWAGEGTGWFAGGTQLVLRRIAMQLDTWDLLDTHAKSESIGRDIKTGAPLTGTEEFDTPDLDTTNELGLSVIPDFAHIRRSAPQDSRQKFLRRPFNYDNGFDAEGKPDVGLIFAAYTSNIRDRFIPVQERLAEMDLLNLWTTPIGSSVFVIPPGCNEGGFIGETLLS